jgi:hypothetical protein
MSTVTRFGIGGYDPTKPNNNIIEEYETPDPAPQPLDPTGALATLLAVLEVATVQDAANAVGLTPDDLIAEAQAWEAARS